MADNPQEFPTIIGPDASFKGELSFEKGVRLQGKFEGNILTQGRLHVTKEAHMSADVDAGAISVEGNVKGKLNASDRIELKQSARVDGDIRANKLTVDEGAVFNGHISVGPEAVKGGAGGGGAAGAARPAQQTARPVIGTMPQGQGVKQPA